MQLTGFCLSFQDPPPPKQSKPIHEDDLPLIQRTLQAKGISVTRSVLQKALHPDRICSPFQKPISLQNTLLVQPLCLSKSERSKKRKRRGTGTSQGKVNQRMSDWLWKFHQD